MTIFRSLQFARWRVFLFLLFSISTTATAADVYSRATKIGNAKGLDAIGCKGGFPDWKGECFKCRSGYSHNAILTVDDPKVCKDEGGSEKITGTFVKNAVVGIPACPSGSWISTHNGGCYQCPSGYTHDNLKMGNEKGVCWKDNADKFSKADKMTGSLVCANGFFDLINGGTCWTCPAATPVRTVNAKVDSDRACVSEQCGKDGGRPCLITAGRKSCDPGLFEDIIQNKCVTEKVAFEICKATVNSIKAGKIPEQFKPFMDQAAQKTQSVTGQLPALRTKALDFVEKSKDAIPELQRIYAFAQNEKAKMDALFDTETLCSPSKMKAMAKTLITPNYKGHLFVAFSRIHSAAIRLGAQGGFTIATDFIDKVGVYGWIGPQLNSNASIGVASGVQFYPKAELTDFEGWGWGIGVSGGPPALKVVGGGVDVSFGQSLLPVGFGANIGVGVGVLPVETAIAATYSWKLISN